jgi:hypothetical protein
MKLIEGHNWVFTIHIFLVAPMLILIPLAVVNKTAWNVSENAIHMMMYTLIAFGIAVLLYHANKLRNNL